MEPLTSSSIDVGSGPQQKVERQEPTFTDIPLALNKRTPKAFGLILGGGAGRHHERPMPPGPEKGFALYRVSWWTRLHFVRLRVKTDRSIRTPASRFCPQQRKG